MKVGIDQYMVFLRSKITMSKFFNKFCVIYNESFLLLFKIIVITTY